MVYTHTHMPLHRHEFTHRFFYTLKFSHTEALHTEVFTRPGDFTGTCLHTQITTRKNLYTQTFLQTGVFTHECLQTLLRTLALTHRRFDTQMFFGPWHFETQYHRGFLHTKVFTHTKQEQDHRSDLLGTESHKTLTKPNFRA